MTDSPNITSKQQAVYDCLPETRKNIADHLDISRRSVRYRMDAIEEDTPVEFERDSDGVWCVSDGSLEEDEELPSGHKENSQDAYTKTDQPSNGRAEEELEPFREDIYDKAQNTKDVHNALTKLEKEVKEALSNSQPVLNVTERTEGKSTLVLPHSDSHVGAVIKERPTVEYYSAEEAREAITEYFERAVNDANQREDVEDVVLILNGDHLDGEGVFPGQRHEQEDNLRDQLRKAGNTYIEQILMLSCEFESVEVYAVPGNHGNIDRESTTNADMMLYDFVETALSYSDADNIRFEKAHSGGYLSFDIRGWEYFTRHGENYLKHIGTSSGIRRALDWYTRENGFDVGLRSHYHSIKWETIADEVPIIMTGSTAPPSTFAEQSGSDGGETAAFWYATEDNPIESFEQIRLGSCSNY
jgi:hypothetical protein